MNEFPLGFSAHKLCSLSRDICRLHLSLSRTKPTPPVLWTSKMCTVLYGRALYFSELYCPVLAYSALYYFTLYSSIVYISLLFSSELYCYTLWCNVLYASSLFVLHATVGHCTVCTVIHCTVHYCTGLHGIVLWFTAHITLIFYLDLHWTKLWKINFILWTDIPAGLKS